MVSIWCVEFQKTFIRLSIANLSWLIHRFNDDKFSVILATLRQFVWVVTIGESPNYFCSNYLDANP